MPHIEEIKTECIGISDSQQIIDHSINLHSLEIVKEEKNLINERVERWYNRAMESMSGFQ